MSPLGRGLASLIPKRNNSNAGDIIDGIDNSDDFNIEKEVKITTNKIQVKETEIPKESSPARISVVEEEESSQEEDILRPVKPLVTPLSFDPYKEEKAAKIEIQKEEEEISVKIDKEEVDFKAAEEDLFSMPKETNDVKEEMPVEVKEEEPAVVEPQEEPSVARKEEQERMTPGFGETNISMWDKHEEKVEHVPVGDIKINPMQPRRLFDPAELEELTSSIEQHGVLQPLVVRRIEDGYELIAGERRLRAIKTLKWERVPCVVRRDVKSDQSRLVFALIENIQRENLNPIEEAMAYKELNEEYGLSHEEIGRRVGRSRVGITNIIRILQLPAEIQRGLSENKITMGHARAILMIPDQEKQIRFYHHMLDEGLTVRKAEIRARRIQRTMNGGGGIARGRARARHPLALKYSPILEERYGYDANVKFLPDKNRFEVVFKAHSESEIEELVARLSGSSPLPKNVDKDVLED